MKGVGFNGGILKKPHVFKKERDCLRCEWPFLPWVTHQVGEGLCHLFLLEPNAECGLFGSEEAAMGRCLKLHCARLAVPVVLEPQHLSLPTRTRLLCLPRRGGSFDKVPNIPVFSLLTRSHDSALRIRMDVNVITS